MLLRRPFVFSLEQNFSAQLAAGQLAYKKSPDDLRKRLLPVFFIGVGRRRIITGPYELTSNEIIYDPASPPQTVVRMEEINPVFGIWKDIVIESPYRACFRNLTPIKNGLTWDFLCREFQIDPKAWHNLIKVELDEDQIKALADYLTKINTEEVEATK